MAGADIGIYGLGVMGLNIALNMQSKGFTVAVYNRTLQRVTDFAEGPAKGKNVICTYSLADFVRSLCKSRKIMVMVRAGDVVDTVINDLSHLLERGDLIIDGGNSHFADTARRTSELAQKGLLFIGAGISGGAKGALDGPSIMAGGSKKAYELVWPILTKIAAHIGTEPCCAYVGDGGAGHYVKMVHNGIEYSDMQLISEAYQLMKVALGMTGSEIRSVFEVWNAGLLSSYLTEITADILAKKDSDTGEDLVEMILDEADQKGTGVWAGQSALAVGTAAPAITEAVFGRCIAADKSERIALAQEFKGPDSSYQGPAEDFVNALEAALYAAKICAYAQGFALMRRAAKEYSWALNLGQIARIWRGGCIIRARLLGQISDAFEREPGISNLLFDSYFKTAIRQAQPKWRKVVSVAAQLGIAAPGLASALNYFDSYRTERSSSNLIQAQRDYFGGHTYKRIDKQGRFHTDW